MPHPSLTLRSLFGASQQPDGSPTPMLRNAHRLIRAMRIAGLFAVSDSDVHKRLVDVLGDNEAASAFRLLLAGMGHVWPDRLVVFRPCCPQLTHDEASLLAMVHYARANDLRGFDAHFADMIGADERRWLFVATQRLARQLPG